MPNRQGPYILISGTQHHHTSAACLATAGTPRQPGPRSEHRCGKPSSPHPKSGRLSSAMPLRAAICRGSGQPDLACAAPGRSTRRGRLALPASVGIGHTRRSVRRHNLPPSMGTRRTASCLTGRLQHKGASAALVTGLRRRSIRRAACTGPYCGA